MIQMNSDISRKARYENASIEAHKDHFNNSSYRSMNERLSDLRSAQQRKAQRRSIIPWFKIIMIVSTAWIVMKSDLPKMFKSGDLKQTSHDVIEAINVAKDVATAGKIPNPQEGAKVTIEVGGQQFTQNVSLEDLQALRHLNLDQ